MQPFPPVDAVRLMYQEKMRAQLAWQRPGRSPISDITAMRLLRTKSGHALVSIGMRIDPAARYLFKPGFG